MIVQSENAAQAFDILNLGIALHVKGDLDLAELQYRKILDASGTVGTDAQHLLANIFKVRGQHAEALEWVNRAISVSPQPIYFNTRGAIFMDLKNYPQALDDLNRSYKSQPKNFELLVNLCGVHRSLKNTRKAIDFGQQATSVNPSSDLGWINLAGVHLDQGMTKQALEGYKHAVDLNGASPVANLNYGKLLSAYESTDKALPHLKLAADAAPHSFDAQVAYANALVKLERPVEAVDPLVRAMQAGKTIDIKSLTENTEQMNTFFQVANVLRVLSKFKESQYVYERLVEAAPDTIIFLCNLAIAHMDKGNLAESANYYARVLEIDEHSYEALHGRGLLHVLNQNIQGAVDDFEHIRRYQPKNAGNLSWLYAEKMHGSMWDGVTELRDEILQIAAQDRTHPISTFVMLSLTDEAKILYSNAVAAAQQTEAPYIALKAQKLIRKSRKNDRIKIGYISNDFRQHPLGVLASELFMLHDRDKFEVTAYSYSVDDGSAMRKRIAATAERFVDMTHQSILEMANNIRDDGCEILVDLTCSTRGGRPQVMCLRPAPVQAAWLGFIGTMGSKYYDYVIGDTTVIAEDHFDAFSEKTLRLPHTMQINDPNREVPRVDVKKADFGIDENTYLLCNFNQAYKTQPQVFECWTKILQAVPKARLWLLEENRWATETWKSKIAEAGLTEDRLILAPRLSGVAHLERYAVADLALDTYPVNSGATGSDALWSGCPMLTRLGNSMVSRMGASLVQAAGLPEMVVNDFDEYVAKAIYYAEHMDELRVIKRKLQSTRSTSPLFDAPMMVRDLEAGYTVLADLIRDEKPYEHITVPKIPRSALKQNQ
jgi:protein O-GlcNAc transferase